MTKPCAEPPRMECLATLECKNAALSSGEDRIFTSFRYKACHFQTAGLLRAAQAEGTYRLLKASMQLGLA